MSPHVDLRSIQRNEDDWRRDSWQPLGLLARRIVRRLRVPPATAIAALEAAGLLVEAD